MPLRTPRFHWAEGQAVEDAAWVYPDPLPECPRIKDHLCFYPEKVDLEVEGEVPP